MKVTDQGNVSIGLTNALFSLPIGTAFDSSSNFYVCDFLNHRIREITPTGVVTTIVGNGLAASTTPGTGTGVSIAYPFGIALDGSGNAYFTEYPGFVRRLVLSTGAVSAVGTTSGNTRSPLVIGSTIFVTQGTAGTIATMGVSGTPASNTLYPLFPAVTYSPFSLVYDNVSRIYLAANTYIMRLGPWGVGISSATSTGTTMTFTTSSAHGFAVGDLVSVQGATGPTSSTNITSISGSGSAAIVTVNIGASAGILPGHMVTISGAPPYNGTYCVLTVPTGTQITFLSTMTGVATLSSATLTWCQYALGWRALTSASGSTFAVTGTLLTNTGTFSSGRASVASVFAGSNVLVTTDGNGTAARFNNVTGLCIDPTNTILYASEYSGNVIRRITISDAGVTTIAGTVGVAGYVDARGTRAIFNNPSHLTIDSSGSNLYISDQSGAKIRRLNIPTSNVTTYAGTGVNGFADGSVPTTTIVNNTLSAGSVGVNTTTPLAPLTVNSISGVSGGGSFYSTCNCAMMVFGSNSPLPTDVGGNATALFFSTDYVANGLGASIGLGGRAFDYPGNGGPFMMYGKITGGSDGGTSYGGILSFATISNNGIMYERMRITSNGNVGINCNAPVQTLDVGGILGLFTPSDGFGGTTRFAMYTYGNTFNINPRTSGGAYNSIAGLVVASNGNVGIQCNAPAAYALAVEGQAMVSVGITPQLTVRGTSSTGGGVIRLSNANTGGFWNISGPDSGYTLYIVNPSSTGVYLGNGAQSWTAASDSRLKTIIEPVSNATSAFEAITPVYYTLNACINDKRRIGVIAQEVLPHFPEVVDTDANGMYGVRYSELVSPLITAIKELSARLSNVEAMLAAAGTTGPTGTTESTGPTGTTESTGPTGTTESTGPTGTTDSTP
jgi:hypothetical protein